MVSRLTDKFGDSGKKKVLARREPRPPFLFEGELREGESPDEPACLLFS